MRFAGSARPEAMSAERTRSRDSATALSGRPTIVKTTLPGAICTCTSTAAPRCLRRRPSKRRVTMPHPTIRVATLARRSRGTSRERGGAFAVGKPGATPRDRNKVVRFRYYSRRDYSGSALKDACAAAARRARRRDPACRRRPGAAPVSAGRRGGGPAPHGGPRGGARGAVAAPARGRSPRQEQPADAGRDHPPQGAHAREAPRRGACSAWRSASRRCRRRTACSIRPTPPAADR